MFQFPKLYGIYICYRFDYSASFRATQTRGLAQMSRSTYPQDGPWTRVETYENRRSSQYVFSRRFPMQLKLHDRPETSATQFR